MTPENKKFLEDNRYHWITLRDAFFMRHLDGNTREGMRRVMSEEFRPGYSADLWCAPCVSEMVTTLYREFENWERAQVQVPLEPEPVEAPITEPVQIKAAFPSHAHKKNHKR